MIFRFPRIDLTEPLQVALLAAALLLTWFAVRLIAKKLFKPSEFELFHNTIQIDGFDVYYKQLGYGPDVLLIHGIGASQYCWRLLAPLLAEKYHVTIIDLPGFGQSSKLLDADYDLDSQGERLYKIICELKLVKPSLVGSSMGGALAFWIAKNYPKKISKVCGISPAVNPKLVPRAISKMSWTSAVVTTLVNELTMKQVLRNLYNDKSLVSSVTIANYLRPYVKNKNAIKVFFKALKTLKDPRLPELFSHLSTPTMVLYGLQDKTVPKRKLTPFLDLNPNCIYDETNGGHHLMEDNPDWVAKKLHWFFKLRS